MDKRPGIVIEAAKRIAKANNTSVKEVFAKYHIAVKKTAFSAKDFLLASR